MKETNVLVVSRTPWYETPRIRHQLSRLLRDSGYEVYYVETIFGSKPYSTANEPGIRIFRVTERIHHQLKFLSILDDMNNANLKKQIQKLFTGMDFVVIFNFNYDLDWLGSYFNAPVISVINDDFIASAMPWMKKRVQSRLTLTCSRSDYVLSVSYSLDRALKKITNNCELFLPWSANPYARPSATNTRDVVLYFGFISRIDTRIIDELCDKNIRIRFVGPTSGDGIKVKKKYETYVNIEFLPACPLNELDLDDVCCSIALYDINDPTTLAITASNRLFQILAEGIPLVYPDMPNLIVAPPTVIARCSKAADFPKAINFFKSNFYNVQDDIKSFLESHTMEKRSAFIDNLITGINSDN